MAIKKKGRKKSKPINRCLTKNFSVGFFFAMAELLRQGVSLTPMIAACNAAGYEADDILKLPIEPYDLAELGKLIDELRMED